MTGMARDNSENLAKVREAMAKAQVSQVADQVNAGDNTTHTETINFTSSFGNTYQGQVVFKRPNALDLMRIGGLKAQYFSEAGITNLEIVDNSVRLLAHVLAHLKVLVLKCPAWLFDVDKVDDMELIYEVYGKYRDWEDSFRKVVPTAQAGDSEPSEDAKAVDA